MQILHYLIYRNDAIIGTSFLIVLDTLSYIDYGISGSLSYTYQVTCVNDIGESQLRDNLEILKSASERTVTNLKGKKGRPTNLVCVICDDVKVDAIIDTLILETGTLGIRISNSNRFIVTRSNHNFSLTFDGKSFEVNYKKSSHKGKTHFKIEFDDLKNMSNALDRPIVDIESFLRKEIEKIEDL